MRTEGFDRYRKEYSSVQNRSLAYKIGRLVAGVRYIARPTTSEALFSYRRAA